MGQIDRPKSNWKINLINFIFIALIIFGVSYYLASMNNLVVKGFKLQELKKQSSQLINENQEFSSKKVALESYRNIDQKLRDLRMVAIDQIEYVTVKDEIIAKK